jgi:hypothetical protein
MTDKKKQDPNANDGVYFNEACLAYAHRHSADGDSRVSELPLERQLEILRDAITLKDADRISREAGTYCAASNQEADTPEAILEAIHQWRPDLAPSLDKRVEVLKRRHGIAEVKGPGVGKSAHRYGNLTTAWQACWLQGFPDGSPAAVTRYYRLFEGTLEMCPMIGPIGQEVPDSESSCSVDWDRISEREVQECEQIAEQLAKGAQA